MANIRAYEGWWDTSLVDERNERALLSAFIAAIAVAPCFSDNRPTPKEQEILRARNRIASRSVSQFFAFGGRGLLLHQP